MQIEFYALRDGLYLLDLSNLQFLSSQTFMLFCQVLMVTCFKFRVNVMVVFICSKQISCSPISESKVMSNCDVLTLNTVKDTQFQSFVCNISSNRSRTFYANAWHKKLGHVPTKIMNYILKSIQHNVAINKSFYVQIVPLKKYTNFILSLYQHTQRHLLILFTQTYDVPRQTNLQRGIGTTYTSLMIKSILPCFSLKNQVKDKIYFNRISMSMQKDSSKSQSKPSKLNGVGEYRTL